MIQIEEQIICSRCDKEQTELLPSGVCRACTKEISKKHGSVLKPRHVETPVLFEREIYDPYHRFGENGEDEGIESVESVDAFYKRIDEHFGEIATEPMNEVGRTVACDYLYKILLFVAPKNLNCKRSLKAMPQKLLAALWVLAPNLFDGKSLTELAKHIGLANNTLAEYSGEFSRQFNIRNRGQAHFKPRNGQGGSHETEKKEP